MKYLPEQPCVMKVLASLRCGHAKGPGLGANHIMESALDSPAGEASRQTICSIAPSFQRCIDLSQKSFDWADFRARLHKDEAVVCTCKCYALDSLAGD